MRGLEVRRYTSDTNYELIDRTTSTERRGFVNVEASLLYDEPGVINLTVDSLTAEEHGLADQVIIGVGVIYDSAPSEEFARYTIEQTQRRMLGDGRLAWTFSGRSFLARLEDAVVYPSAWPSPVPAGHSFVDATAGTQMRTLTDRAQLRGTITDIDDTTFTGALTSNGVAWSKIISITHGTGTTYLQVLQDLMTKGMCEAEMIGKQLRLYNPDSVLSVHHSDIILRRGDNLSAAELDTESRELGNVILIEGDASAAQEYVDTAAVTALGRRRERYVSHGGITDSGTLQVLAQAEADLYNDVLEEVNVEVPALDIYPQPWKDFKPGHWLWIEDGAGFQEVRIRQLTLSQNDAGVQATVTLNDKIAEQALKLQRKIDAITGSSQYGAISNPDQADNTVPMPPPTVNISSAAYILANGTVNAQITVTWTAPTANTDASSYDDPGGFEVQYQITGEAWTPMGNVDSGTLAAFASGLEPGKGIKARVRAYDTNLHYSTYTTSSTITTAGDSNPPAQPSTPTVDTAPLALKISWDGTVQGGGTMAFDVYRVWVHVSTTNGFTANASNRYASFGSRGLQTLYAIDLTYGTTYYFRLTAEDYSGTIGPQSNQVSAVFPQITTVDVIDGLVTDLKLADNAVTSPKIFPEAVTTEKLTVGAFSDSVLPNGTMEQAKQGNPAEPANWYRNGQTGAGLPIVYDTSSPLAGDASLRMDPTSANGQTAVSEIIDVTPDTVWYVGSRVKTNLDAGTPQPIPTVVGTGAIVSGTAGVVATLPGGVQEFDIIYCFVQSAGGEAVATPSGYAVMLNTPVSQGTGVTGTRLTVFWKRAGTSEGSITLADPGDHIIARTMVIRGASRSGTPHEAEDPSTDATADTTGSIQHDPTTGPNRLVVAVATGQRALGADSTVEYSLFTNPDLASMVERIDNARNVGTIDGTLGVVTGEKASAGAIVNTTYTQAGAALKAHVSFAVKPLELSQLGYVKVELQTATTAAGIDSSPTIHTIYASAGDDTPVPAEIDGGVTIPTNHRYARVALTGGTLSQSYSVWFDDVEFRKIVGTAQIANLAVVDAKIQSLTASKITVGILTADITLAARLKTADTGQRWEANALGSAVYRADNTKATEMSPTALAAYAADGTTALFQALASTGAIILRSGTSGPRIEINTTADAASFRLYTGSVDQTATPAKITTDFNDASSPKEGILRLIGPDLGQSASPQINVIGRKETSGGSTNDNLITFTGCRWYRFFAPDHAVAAIEIGEASEAVRIDPPWALRVRNIFSETYVNLLGPGWEVRFRDPPETTGASGSAWGVNGNIAVVWGGDDSIRSTSSGGQFYKPMQASAFQNLSDVTRKKNVEDLPKDQLERIKGVRPVSFEYRAGAASEPEEANAGVKRGVIAQEVAQHIPEAHYVTDNGEQMVDLMGLVSTLIGAIQELEERVSGLEQQ